MQSLLILKDSLGPLAMPLMTCAALTGLILSERILVLCITSINGKLARRANQLMDTHHHQPRSMQEEVATLWLTQKRRQLMSGIRLLQILAMVAPLLGLLGTVIGLIQVFEDLSDHRGPIEPALLANGLGIAMKTTAVGLTIAVPALLGAHCCQLWVDSLVNRCEQAMNIDSLQREGVCVEALK